MGVTAGAAEVLFGAGDEESAALMQPMPAGEVELAAIPDVERAGFKTGWRWASFLECRSDRASASFFVRRLCCLPVVVSSE